MLLRTMWLKLLSLLQGDLLVLVLVLVTILILPYNSSRSFLTAIAL